MRAGSTIRISDGVRWIVFQLSCGINTRLHVLLKREGKWRQEDSASSLFTKATHQPPLFTPVHVTQCFNLRCLFVQNTDCKGSTLPGIFSLCVEREKMSWVRLVSLVTCGAHLPGSSLSPFIHLMVAAGLLLMAVQVISVSLPSLRTSSRASMMGLPGGTAAGDTNHTQIVERLNL